MRVEVTPCGTKEGRPHGRPLSSHTSHLPLSRLREVQTHRPLGAAFERAMYRACVAHEVLARDRKAREELGGEERALSLIAAVACGDEVARQVTPAARDRDHMIQCGILETEPGPAIDTTASTIPEGRALDLALVLLVLHTASVAG